MNGNFFTSQEVIKFFVFLNIFIQLFFPVIVSFSPAVAAAAEQKQSQNVILNTVLGSDDHTQSQTQTEVARGAIQAGRILSDDTTSNAAKNYFFGIANSKATEEVENWLSNIGHAEVQLGVDERLSLKNSQVGLLIPFAEQQDRFFFTQGNWHYTDDRSQFNLGLGWRKFNDNDLLGANTFFDYDISRGHMRAGLGVEYWRNYFKLTSNFYKGISDWKNSLDFEDYEERVADGWDIRMQGYLPSWPNLGGMLTYEKYYGDSVALYGKNNRFKDPHAVSAGLNYTPFPLLTFNAEHKQGSDTDSRFGLQINYYPGMTWRQHLDDSNVAELRRLSGSRYDFVDRNNNIVLEYRKKQLIDLKMAENISGYSGQRLPLNISVTSKYGFARMEWSAAQFIAQGGKIIETSSSQYDITLPEFDYTSGATNTYEISASAIDSKGNKSNRVKTLVKVVQPAINAQQSQLEPLHAVLVADGKTTQTFTLKVNDVNGQPVDIDENEITLQQTEGKRAADTVTFSPFSKQSAGIYSFTATSGIRPGTLTITPSARGKTLVSGKLELVANKNTAIISELIITPDEVLANGVDTKTVSAKVTDDLGNPVIDADVTFNADNEASIAKSVVKTNDQGIASTTLSTIHAGTVNVTARINQHQLSKQTIFYSDESSATLVSLTPSAPPYIADGNTAVTWSAVVEDKNGNLIPGVRVIWRSDRDSSIVKFSENESYTDADGIARTQITSTRAFDVTVTALANNSFVTANPITFSANTSQRLIASLSGDYQQIAANNSDSALVTARVVDNYGNIIKDAEVHWSVSGTGRLDAVSSITDDNGDAQMKVYATSAGTIQVTAQIDNDSKSYSLLAKGDEQSATITLTTEDDKKSASADDVDAITFVAQVTDSANNPLVDVPVSWSATHNHLSDWSTKTDAQGKTKVSLAGTHAGKVEVSAVVPNGVRQTVAVTFNAGVPVLMNSRLNVYPQTVVAGGDAATVIVALKDQYGNPVNGQSVAYDSSDESSIHFTQSVELGDGRYQAQVSASKEGSFDLRAIINDTESLTAKLGVIASTETAQLASVTVIPPETVNANGTDKVTLRAQVKDENNNTNLPGVSVGWQTTLGMLESPVSVTNSQGIAEITLSSTQAGTAQVRARLGENSMAADKVITFIAGSVSSQQSTFSLSPANIIAEVENTTLTVQAKDDQGNALTGLAADITVTYLPDLQMTAATFAETSAGVYQAQVTGKIAGKTNVSVQIGSTKVDQEQELTIRANPASWLIDSLEADKSSFSAGDSQGVTYSARILDGNGNPLSDVVVSWQLVEGRASGFERSSRTDSLGVASTRLLSETAGNIVMEAWLDKNNFKRAHPVVVTAGEVDAVRSSFTTDKTVIGADGIEAATLTARLVDRFGNPVTDQTVNTHTTGALSTFVINPDPMEDKGDGIYQAKATSTSKGDETINAQVGAVQLNEQVRINVGAITPALRFDNAQQRVTWTRNFTESQMARGIPDGVKQQWSSSDDTVASVDESTGKLTLHQAGTTTITLQTGSNSQYLPAMASYQVIVERADPGLSAEELTIDAIWNDGVARQVKATFTNKDVSGLTPVYQSSNPAVVEVDSNGQLTMVKPGNTVTITLSTEETSQFKSAMYYVAVNLNKAQPNITFEQAEQYMRFDQGYLMLPKPVIDGGITADELTWASSDPSVASISNDRLILTGYIGQSVISAQFVENDYYLSARSQFSVLVYDVPQLNMRELTHTSLGQATSGSTWQPAFNSDSVTTSFILLGDAKTRPVTKVTAGLYVNNVLQETRSLTGSDIEHGKVLSVTFTANTSMIDNTAVIKIIAIGRDNDEVTDEMTLQVEPRTTGLIGMVTPTVKFAQRLWDSSTVLTHICTGDDVATLNGDIHVTLNSNVLSYYNERLKYRAWLSFVEGKHNAIGLPPPIPDNKGMQNMLAVNENISVVDTYVTSGSWSLSYRCSSEVNIFANAYYTATYDVKLDLQIMGSSGEVYTADKRFTWNYQSPDGTQKPAWNTYRNFR